MFRQDPYPRGVHHGPHHFRSPILHAFRPPFPRVITPLFDNVHSYSIASYSTWPCATDLTYRYGSRILHHVSRYLFFLLCTTANNHSKQPNTVGIATSASPLSRSSPRDCIRPCYSFFPFPPTLLAYSILLAYIILRA